MPNRRTWTASCLPLTPAGLSWARIFTRGPIRRTARQYRGGDRTARPSGQVVARFGGRIESGPRALGSRSILYTAQDPDANQWLNKRLGRTEFMPFAPATTWEARHRCFRNLAGAEHAAQFMTIAFDCTDFMRKNCPAAVHVDGTARPQLVRREVNAEYHDILVEYEKLSGIPTLINTGFNMHEEAIVRSPRDAVRAFLDGHLDVLAIGPCLAVNPQAGQTADAAHKPDPLAFDPDGRRLPQRSNMEALRSRGKRGVSRWESHSMNLIFSLHLLRRLVCAFLAMLLAAGCSSARAGEPTLLGGEAARVLRVGPGLPLSLPSAAAAVARDGDLIEIEAATYAGDAAVWRRNRLTIRGVGGRPHLRADGAQVEGKAIWVIKGTDTVVENIEFSGARVADGNGAAIRPEGAGLTLRNCSFHDNENGVMGGGNPASEIAIERCEFARNGRGDGLTHNLYIGAVKLLRVDRSYSHRAVIGHNLKSRARETIVTFSRFADEESGRSSYALDLPNGGKVSLVGNVIEHGPQAENSTLVSYGAEGLQDSANELRVRNNTFVNDRAGGGVFIFISPSTPSALVEANLFAGPGTVVRGPASVRDNRVVPTTQGVDRMRAPDGVSVGPGGE